MERWAHRNAFHLRCLHTQAHTKRSSTNSLWKNMIKQEKTSSMLVPFFECHHLDLWCHFLLSQILWCICPWTNLSLSSWQAMSDQWDHSIAALTTDEINVKFAWTISLSHASTCTDFSFHCCFRIQATQQSSRLPCLPKREWAPWSGLCRLASF